VALVRELLILRRHGPIVRHFPGGGLKLSFDELLELVDSHDLVPGPPVEDGRHVLEHPLIGEGVVGIEIDALGNKIDAELLSESLQVLEAVTVL